MALVLRSYFRRTGRTQDYSREESEVAAVAAYLTQAVVGGGTSESGGLRVSGAAGLFGGEGPCCVGEPRGEKAEARPE